MNLYFGDFAQNTELANVFEALHGSWSFVFDSFRV